MPIRSLNRKRAESVRQHAAPAFSYPQALAARWLLRAMEMDLTYPDADFFECASWACDGLEPVVTALKNAASSLRGQGSAEAKRNIRNLAERSGKDLPGGIAELIEADVDMAPLVREATEDLLRQKAQKAKGKSPEAQALQRIFGMDEAAALLCEYAFMASMHRPVSSYFEGCLDLEEYHNRRNLADMLRIDQIRCRELVPQLAEMGVFNEEEDIRLNSCVEKALIAGDEDTLQKHFCMPLTGDTLPLDQFHIPKEALEDVVRLLQCDNEVPLQILVYGRAGTGKSTFARSLAEALGLKAWAVPCRVNADIHERRASLMACLRLAGQNKGAFVLVDEADQMLDTDADTANGNYSEKAWLDGLLEEKGRRIIWITNKVSHLDQAVRRRFSYSVCFDALAEQDRQDVWEQTARRLRVESRLKREDAAELSRKYPVEPSIVENALLRARSIAPRGGFMACLERVLEAHLTLRQDGCHYRPPHGARAGYSLDCICTDVPVEGLIARFRTLDRILRAGATDAEAGAGNMLFYGPAGTGKTELARHIAATLRRECLLKKASDLLSPYVGETEQNIASAFAEAERTGAMLIIDEVDSFLQQRDRVLHSWENTQVNEFLTALDGYAGFCACTTNLYENIDPGVIRRFMHKIRFTYATAHQHKALYSNLLCPLLPNAPEAGIWETLCRQKFLTPGDFSSVRKQFRLEEEGSFGHRDLLNALLREQRMKRDADSKKVGF